MELETHFLHLSHTAWQEEQMKMLAFRNKSALLTAITRREAIAKGENPALLA